VHSRVEQLNPEQRYSTVITRAFASMPEIIRLTAHLVADGGLLLAMKGQRPDDELAGLQMAYSVVPIITPGINAERCLILVEKP